MDIVVNNAGVYPANSTTELSDADLDLMLAVNIRAPHVLVAELVPAVVQRVSGVIVNIGSWMAQVGSPMAAMYTATYGTTLYVDGGISATRFSRGDPT